MAFGLNEKLRSSSGGALRIRLGSNCAIGGKVNASSVIKHKICVPSYKYNIKQFCNEDSGFGLPGGVKYPSEI